MSDTELAFAVAACIAEIQALTAKTTQPTESETERNCAQEENESHDND
jgi:hypothetical protein